LVASTWRKNREVQGKSTCGRPCEYQYITQAYLNIRIIAAYNIQLDDSTLCVSDLIGRIR
jgi:hypothetical protein